MSTDINGVSGIAGQHRSSVTPNQNAAAPAEPNDPHAVPGVRSGDTVELHSANQAKALAESVRNIPVVDGQRVQALREAIASGNYQVDAGRVADKLMAIESELHPARA